MSTFATVYAGSNTTMCLYVDVLIYVILCIGCFLKKFENIYYGAIFLHVFLWILFVKRLVCYALVCGL